MFDKLSEKLNQLMISARVNASELARLTGVPASTIKKIRNCDNPNPTLTTLLPIAKQFGVTLSEFIGETEGCTENQKANITDYINGDIPIIEWYQTINWPDVDVSICDKIVGENRSNKTIYALKIDDQDLIGFTRGSLIIVDTNIAPSHRDYVVAKNRDSDFSTLKQTIMDEGNVYFRSLVDGLFLTTPSNDYQILGTIVEYRIKFKNNKN